MKKSAFTNSAPRNRSQGPGERAYSIIPGVVLKGDILTVLAGAVLFPV